VDFFFVEVAGARVSGGEVEVDTAAAAGEDDPLLLWRT
jgi:hypothetical protein